METTPLTQEQIKLLKDLEGGADIVGYLDALLCRQFEKSGHIQITRVQGNYAAEKRLPYFGAILTAAGRKLLKEVS